MPVLNLENPRRITLTMANTQVRAMSGVQPVNWGVLIHEVFSRAISYIGQNPSYFSHFILNLYQHYECATMTIAVEEVAYKLHLMVADTSTSNDPIIPEAPPSSPGGPPPSFRRPNSPPPPPPHHNPEAVGPSRTQPGTPWRNVDLSAWDFPENPFKRIYDDMADLQTQYHRLEHITRGANQTLDDCGPENILRELAKRADRKELNQAKKEIEHVKTENAHLNA